MIRRSCAARSVLVAVVLSMGALFLLRGFAAPPPEDPLSELRTRTAGMSEADLDAARAKDPGIAVMLAERLAHRDLRGEIARIADLFDSADRALAGSPWLRVEAALLGARLLAFDETRAPAAVARLRAALADPSLPADARAHGLYGLGFLVPEPKEQLRIFLEVEEKLPESAYAPLAVAEATGRAWDLRQRDLIFELEQGLSSLPGDGREARALLTSRLVDCMRADGVADTYCDLPGKVPHRLSSMAQSGPVHGMLIRLSPPRRLEEDLSGEVYDGEQDAPEIVARWTGDAPSTLLDDRPPARYLALSVMRGTYESQIYEITSTAVEARLDANGLVLHACDARNGAPRTGARFLGALRRSPPGDQRPTLVPFSVDADAEGIARIPLDPPARAGETIRVAARACHTEGGADLETTLYGADRSADGVRVALFAARPMVRPGDTIDFRLVAREPSTRGAMTVPTGARFSVSLEDGNGNVFHNEVLALSEFGTATSHATVPDSAALGPVKAHVECQDAGRRIRDPQWKEWDDQMEAFSQFLCRVEEYRLPDVTVSVEPDRPWYVTPGSARVTVRVEAAEGGPVAGFEGSLQLSARSSSWPEPDPLAGLPFLLPPPEEESFDAYDGDQVDLRIPDRARHFVTDADGRAVIDLPLRRLRGEELYLVNALAEGADPQGRSAHGSASFRLVRDAARVKLSLDWDWHAPRIAGNARVLDPMDRPVNVPVRVTVLAGDGHEVARRDLSPGDGAISIDGLPGGTYRVEARAEVDGHVVSAREWAWVRGDGGEMASEQLTLRGDREVYRPGETLTARAIVPQGVRAVLATLENDRLIAVRCVPVTDGAAEIALLLPPEAAPNVRLVVSAWKDGMRQEASLDRFVDAGGAPLAVEVTADPPTAPPGSEASWTVRVHDAAGQPVDAEVSLAVVDSRVYALQEDPAPSLLRRFAPLPKRYRVVHERSKFTVNEVSDGSTSGTTAAFCLSEESTGDAMPPYEPVVRKDFHDLAGWFPSLRTGPSGEVTVKARFSDSLTPWRATARAFAANGTSGEARGEARTLLPVTLRLDAPSLVHSGDEVEVGVLVRNHGDASRTGTVSLEIEGLTAADANTPREVSLPAGGSVVCRWRLTANQDAATARLRAAVRLGDAGDAVEKTLPVLPALTRVPITASLRVGATGHAIWNCPQPPDPGHRRIELSAAPEDLERLLAPLDELLHYPYGCAEQTMSGFLPAIVVRETLEGLGVCPPSLALQAAAVSQAGVGRLQGFQHEDGGWGWWTGDETDPFMTAYVVHGLLLAKAHRVEVDDAALTRGVDCLAGLERTCTDPETRAFARWVLVVAGRTPEGAEARPGPGSSAIEIACTLREAHRAGDATEAARLGRLLVDSADASQEGKLRWAGRNGFFAYSPVATSLAIEALLEAGVEAPAAQSGLRWLDENRSGAAYGSTIANACATLACARELAGRGGRFASTDLRVRVGGKDVAPEAAEKGDPATHWGVGAQDALTLELENAGKDPMILWVRGQDWVRDEHLPPAVGVAWTRGLWRLLPGGEPEREDAWAEVGENDAVAVGPVYEIRYRIGGSVGYLAIDDPRPAGLVPVRSLSGFDASSGAYVEWRDRATTAFVRNAREGTLVRLAVRFDTPGRVVWPAARAFAMYDESQQAFSPSRVLVVAPEAPPGASGVHVPELAELQSAWREKKDLDAETWSAWRRIDLDLPDAERSELRALARTVQRDGEPWEFVGPTVIDGLLRIARADDPRDVDLLLELEGTEPNGALSTTETWFPFETELARAAVQRRSERAWAILGRIQQETGEPDAVLDAMEEAGPRLRGRCLGEFVRWFAENMQGDIFWGRSSYLGDGRKRNDGRFKALLAEWLGLRAAERAGFGAEALTVCEWAYGKVKEHAGEADWEAFREAAVRAAVACEDRAALYEGTKSWGLGPMNEALARRSIAEGDRELWACQVQAWASDGGSPRMPMEAMAGVEGGTQDAVLDLFVVNWFTSSPSRSWGSPEEWRADVDRLVALLSRWNDAHEQGDASLTGVRVAAFGWMNGVIARARDNGGTVEPAWLKLRGDLHARFATLDPVAAADGLAELGSNLVWDDPTVKAWIGDRWLELAPGAPSLVLERLIRESETPDHGDVIARVAALPPAARAALLGAALQGDWDPSRPWLEAFATDAAPEVRARIAECLLRHVDDCRWDGVFATRPDLIVGHLGDHMACTLGVASRLGLVAALPALREIAQRDPAFLVPRAALLRRWVDPGVHEAVAAALEAVHKGAEADAATCCTLACASDLTQPMQNAAAVFEMAASLKTHDGQTSDTWKGDLQNLGLRGDVELVRSAIADARDPQVALLLALGAAQRHDERLVVAWRADLDGSEGVHRDLAFVALAHDGSPEAAEALRGWLATDTGRRFLVRPDTTGVELNDDGSIHAGYLGAMETVVPELEAPKDPVGIMLGETLPRLSAMLPEAAAWRLISGAHPREIPLLLVRWIDNFRPKPETATTAIAGMMALATRILGPMRFVNEPGAAALKFLEAQDRTVLLERMAKSGDREFVACARLVASGDDDKAIARLDRIATGDDPLLARHARAALEWGKEIREQSPFELSRLPNPFAVPAEAVVVDAIRQRFGEDPFAPMRVR